MTFIIACKMITTYVVPLSLAVIFYMIKYFIEIGGTIGNFIIFEGDYRNMYPYIEQPQVSNENLGIICLIPIICYLYHIIFQIFVSFLLDRFYQVYFPRSKIDWNIIIKDIAISSYFLIFSYMTLACTMMFTEVIKNVVAMPRPNFFYICDYQKINSNYTFYLENVMIDRDNNYFSIADISKCYADSMRIEDSISSFPSGHSSYTLSIALSCFIFTKYTKRKNIYHIITFMLFFLSFYVGISRIMDYYHNVCDVIFGFFLAICVNILFLFFFNDFTSYIIGDTSSKNNIILNNQNSRERYRRTMKVNKHKLTRTGENMV